MNMLVIPDEYLPIVDEFMQRIEQQKVSASSLEKKMINT